MIVAGGGEWFALPAVRTASCAYPRCAVARRSRRMHTLRYATVGMYCMPICMEAAVGGRWPLSTCWALRSPPAGHDDAHALTSVGHPNVVCTAARDDGDDGDDVAARPWRRRPSHRSPVGSALSAEAGCWSVGRLQDAFLPTSHDSRSAAHPPPPRWAQVTPACSTICCAPARTNRGCGCVLQQKKEKKERKNGQKRR